MALRCYCLNSVFETHYLQENVLNKYFINLPFVVNSIWKQMSDSSFQTMADEGEYHLIISTGQVRWALMNTGIHKPSWKTTLLQDGKAVCWITWDARRGLVHLFIGALRDAGETCPLPGSFSKQNHSGGRKSYINRKFTTYFTMTSFMSEGCVSRAQIGSALGCWCVCCCSLWPGDITLICPVLVSQDASAWSQPIRSQKRKRSIDTSKRKAKPGIIEEPNRGRSVRLAGDGRQRQWGWRFSEKW